MLDIAIELAEAERLLVDPSPDTGRLRSTSEALRRDARNPNVIGDQRQRASALAATLDSRARAAEA